jgi:hypothetical protein
MKYRALRGICIGVERHLAAGDVEDLTDPQLVQFLIGIAAIEKVDEAPPDEPTTAEESSAVDTSSKPARRR